MRPPAGVNLTALESRLKRIWRMRRSSPETTCTSGSISAASATPFLLARSRTITTPRSTASRRENGATSSSIWPASTFDRSSTSLISESRWLPEERMSSTYSSCFSFSSPNSLFSQHLGEAENRVERRAQLVRHVREELALVPAHGLELAVQALELVVHLVDAAAEVAELVPVGDLHVAGEVAGGNPTQPSDDALDRPDERPREEVAEQEREDDRAGRGADEEVARADVRAAVRRDEQIGLVASCASRATGPRT